MGFVPGLTTQIEAFLTERGAQEIMNYGVNNIKYFAISDDASNYATSNELTYGEVFSLAGKLIVQDRITSVINLIDLPSKIFVDNSNETLKEFSMDTMAVNYEQSIGDLYTTSLFNIFPYQVDRTNVNSSYLNWIIDLKLPYGQGDNAFWSANFDSGGFSNTAISDMNTDNFLVFVMDGTQHAYIDGKSIKFTLPYYASSVDLYGTYLNLNKGASFYDPLNSDPSNYLGRFGGNTVLLFCDDIQKPNNNALNSWSTGYNFPNAPFTQGGKKLANFIDSPGFNKDVAVGIAYLDKGVIVIFNGNLYNGYINNTNNVLSITNRNVVKRIAASFVCDLPMSKFYRSPNPTFTLNSPVRISSIGLYNSNRQLVAAGRLSSEIEKSSAERFTFLVKLVI